MRVHAGQIIHRAAYFTEMQQGTLSVKTGYLKVLILFLFLFLLHNWQIMLRMVVFRLMVYQIFV